MAAASQLHGSKEDINTTAMAIIISRDGKNAIRLDKTAFDDEKFLQRYIYENPESIPLYDIKEDIRLLIVAREFQTRSGPIDALGIDQDGEIYIIETKLFANADKRRVIAQLLDYGAALWKQFEDFANFTLEVDSAVIEMWGMPLGQKLRQFFGLPEAQILDGVRTNLANGAFRFVVLMDRLDARLKDLVSYVNHNSQFDVYAVEFEYYRHDTQEIIIPKIFGGATKKGVVTSSGGARKQWTGETVLAEAKQKLSSEEFAAFKDTYEFSTEHADELRYGTGSYGSFSPIFRSVCSRSLFTLTTDKRLSFNFEWIGKDDEKIAEAFKDRLQAIGFTFAADYRKIRPSVPANEWVPRVAQFLEVLSAMLLDFGEEGRGGVDRSC